MSLWWCWWSWRHCYPLHQSSPLMDGCVKSRGEQTRADAAVETEVSLCSSARLARGHVGVCCWQPQWLDPDAFSPARANWLLCTMNTPLVNQRAWLQRSGRKSSVAKALSGLSTGLGWEVQGSGVGISGGSELKVVMWAMGYSGDGGFRSIFLSPVCLILPTSLFMSLYAKAL